MSDADGDGNDDGGDGVRGNDVTFTIARLLRQLPELPSKVNHYICIVIVANLWMIILFDSKIATELI